MQHKDKHFKRVSSMNDESSNRHHDEVLLITRAKQNDLEAFEQLYRHHIGRVYALCLRLTGTAALAEEFAQEAFIRAWQKIRLFRGESSFSSWLYRLTSNIVISHLRKKQHFYTRLDETINEEHLAAQPVDNAAVMDLEQGITKLPAGARTIFVLHDIEGYQHNEISKIVGIAVGTSKAQLHRARKLLREWI